MWCTTLLPCVSHSGVQWQPLHPADRRDHQPRLPQPLPQELWMPLHHWARGGFHDQPGVWGHLRHWGPSWGVLSLWLHQGKTTVAIGPGDADKSWLNWENWHSLPSSRIGGQAGGFLKSNYLNNIYHLNWTQSRELPWSQTSPLPHLQNPFCQIT